MQAFMCATTIIDAPAGAVDNFNAEWKWQGLFFRTPLLIF
jgi:hypothetical protein